MICEICGEEYEDECPNCAVAFGALADIECFNLWG